ncbi:hypothetical protein ACFX2F_028132 [Malus domestica]
MEMEAEEHEKESLRPESENQTPVKGVRDLLWTPINWFRMLSSELHWSFVVGVLIVYNISQGLSMVNWSEDRFKIAFFDVETTVPTRPGQGFTILEFG